MIANPTEGTILIVDDLPENLRVLTQLLSENGYRIRAAKTGSEALDSIKASLPDLILLDIKLPDISGLEVCSKIKADSETRDVAVVFLSALGDSSDIIKGFEVGGIDYIVKPFKTNEVLVRVKTQIEISQMRKCLKQQTLDLQLTNEKLLTEIERSLRGENEIKTRNNLLTSLINSPKDIIIFSLDRNYCYTAFNEKHCNEMKTVWNANIKIGMSLLECMSIPELAVLAKKSIDRAFCGEVFFEIQHQPSPNIYYEFSWNPIYQYHEVIGATCFVRNITERIHAEQALRQSEEKFRNIFEHTGTGKSMTTIDGKINVNKAFCDILGYTPTEISNLKWQEITYPGDVEHDQEIINSIISGERINARWEKRYIHKNGEIVWVDINTTLQSDESGKPLHFITSIVDITSRKKAIEEKTRFLTIIEKSLNEIYVFDAQSLKFIYVNKGAIINLGFTIEEMNHFTPLDIKPDYSFESFNELIRPLINNEKERLIFQTSHRRKNKSLYPVEVYLQLIIVGEEKVFLAVINDISERLEAELLLQEKNEEIEAQSEEYQQLNEELMQINKELEEAKEHAEQSDHLKTAFLQNMSHEIRTPMNAIMGFSELLTDNYNNKTKLEQFSQIIRQRCDDLLNIINEILDIAKIESGQIPVNIEECKLVPLFSEISMFFIELQKRQNKLHIDFDMEAHCGTSDSIILADKVKLKQILINLIGNAFKFTEKGEIKAGCKLNVNHQLLFYVSDTGIGIPFEKQNFIFERFAQLEQTPDHLYGGTGLGLSIVKGLVDIMDGKIWLESEINKGTTFYFSFPYEVVNRLSHDHLSHDEIHEKFNFSNRTILIVEDDLYNAEYLKEVLSGTGFTILHSIYGKEAIQISKLQKLDMVLMDIRLPDIDGYTATRAIKKHNPDLKIIAQTAYASQDDKEKSIDAGCNDYISKPVKRDILLSMINKQLLSR